MTAKSLILTAVIFLVLFSAFSMADQITTLIIWIEGTIGVGSDYDDNIIMEVGGTNGTWVVIHNPGNIRDVLRLEGELKDSSAGEEYKDWIKFSFKCAESVGMCDDIPSSETKYVDEIELTPKINQTRFYVEVTGYKITPPDTVNLSITGYSLTNYTKQTDFINIGINVKSTTGTYEPEELPGISPAWIPLFLLLSGLVFYKKIV